MVPRTDHEFLAVAGLRRSAALAHTQIIANRATQEDVVPAADITGRNGNRVMPVFDIELRPVVVVVRMCHPVVKIGRRLPKEWKIFKRQMTKRLTHIVDSGQELSDLIPQFGPVFRQPHGRIGRQTGHGPACIKAQCKGSALIRPAFVVIGRRNQREDRLQMGRLTQRRQPLGGPNVGRAIHTHIAVRPRLYATPFNRVIAVGHIVTKGVKLSVRGVAATRVLDDNGIALTGGSDNIKHEHRNRRQPLVIRGPLQDHRMPSRCRTIDIGAQQRAVPHRDGHISFNRQGGLVHTRLLNFPTRYRPARTVRPTAHSLPTAAAP